jgi:hypothetical protein
MILFQKADFESSQIAPLDCGERITVLSTHDFWAKIRTQGGSVGYEPTWFIGPPHVSEPSKSAKCNRPPPLENIDQFERLSAIFESYIDAEKFTSDEFGAVSRKDTENLAADSYFLGYLSADNPTAVKDTFSKAFVDDHIFGKDFAQLTPVQKITTEIWVQKLLNVLNKAMDLGFQDGSKYPCSPGQPAPQKAR